LENDQIKPAVTNQAKILQNRIWQSLENIFQQHKNTNTAFLLSDGRQLATGSKPVGKAEKAELPRGHYDRPG